MKINIICQLCGRTHQLETGETQKLSLKGLVWESWLFQDFGLEHEDYFWYRKYELWFCPECLGFYIEHQDKDGTDLDWDKLTEAVINSLGETKNE